MKRINNTQMEALKNNYLNRTQKKEKDEYGKEPYRPLCADDTRSSWFSRADIDKLFDDNKDAGPEMGLRIHLITHDYDYKEPQSEERHKNQQTIALTVTNKDGNSIINDEEDEKDQFSYRAKAGVSEKLCPPEICPDVSL